MKDVIGKYSKRKKMSNIGIIVSSLIIALSINFLVLDWNNLTNSLKTNIMESKEIDNKAELYLENNNWILTLNTSKNLNNIKNITLSFIYNPENVEIVELISSLNSSISNFSNVDGITTVIIDFPIPVTFNINEQVLKVNINKIENISEQLNIINANFMDIDNETYLPTTSGITF